MHLTRYASGRCVHADERIFGTMRVDDATSDNFVIVVPARGTQPVSKNSFTYSYGLFMH